MITLTPAAFYTRPSDRENQFLIKKVCHPQAKIRWKQKYLPKNKMSAKYHFFCAEINVDKARLYGAQKGLQLESPILTLRIITKRLLEELKRMVDQDFRISLGITTLEG